MKKNYSCVDILKLFFAFCIVGIHTKIFRRDNNFDYFIMHGIFRLAVPFFFTCSGFFLARKLENSKEISENKQIIKEYIKRLIIPFAFWLIIGLPQQLQTIDTNGGIVELLKKIVFYPWGALWYISALIIGILLVIPFYRKKKIKYAVIMGMILYIFALICNNYYFLIKNTFMQNLVDGYIEHCISARNGIFVGFLFVSIGFYLAEKIKKLDNKKCNLFLILAYIIFTFEIFFIKGRASIDDAGLYLSFIFLIPLIFIVAANCKISFQKLDTKLLRNYSTGIYFMHSPLKSLIVTITLKLGFEFK